MVVFQSIWLGFLDLPHFWIIFILAFLTTFLTTIIYKYATDQKRLKEIKTKLKELRKKQKQVSKDQKKLMELQKEMMTLNMEMMKQSFKSMIYTFLPLILLFTWMSANIAYEPLSPGEEFSVTARISNSFPYDLKEVNLSIIPSGDVSFNEGFVASKESRREIQWFVSVEEPGIYSLVVESPTFSEVKEILISDSKDYRNPVSDFRGSQLLKVEVGNEPVRPLGSFSIFGLRPNWLFTYIILSILLSIFIRRLLKVS